MNTIATIAAAVRLSNPEAIQARVAEMVASVNWESKVDYQEVKELFTNPEFIAKQKEQMKSEGAVLSRLVDIKDPTFDDKMFEAFYTVDFIKDVLAINHLLMTREITFAGYVGWMNYRQSIVAKETGLLSQAEYTDLLTASTALEGCLSKAYEAVEAMEDKSMITDPHAVFEILDEDFVRQATPETPKAVQDKVIAYLEGLKFVA